MIYQSALSSGPVIGNIIRQGRKRKGWTQAQLAEPMGVKQGLVSQWEKGDIRPSLAKRAKIAGLLDIPTADLVPELVSLHGTPLADRLERLVGSYKRLPPEHQTAVLIQIEALAESLAESSPPTDSSP